MRATEIYQTFAAKRVRELCENFDRYTDAFERNALFTGPSVYFHKKTLNIRREYGGSVVACIADANFTDSLYATLASWGLHRMGPGNAKLESSIPHSSSPSVASKSRCAA
jgi:hypothetical protein